MRASSGLDSDDALGRERAGLGQDALILPGVDVVRDDAYAPSVAHCLAKLLNQRGLAGSNRSADTHAKRIAFHTCSLNQIFTGLSPSEGPSLPAAKNQFR